MRILRGWVLIGGVLWTACDDKAGIRYPCGRQCEAMERCDLGAAKCVLNNPPAVAFSTPMEDEVVTTAQILVSGRLSDDAFEFVSPELSLDDGATWQELVVDPEGDFLQRYDVPALDGKTVNATIRVHDSLGAEGRGVRRFSIDRVAPRCRITAPGATDVLTGAMGQLTLEVLDDSQRYGGAELSLDNGVTWQTTTVADATAHFTFALHAVNGVKRPIQVRASDAAGNRCEVAAELTIDTVGPTLTPVAPVEAEQLKAIDGPTFEVQFQVADPAGVTSAEVLAPPSAQFAAATITNGVAHFMWTLPASDDGALRQLQLKATDAIGNVTTQTLDVAIDLVPPSCVLVTPMAAQTLNLAAGPTFDVTWTVSDGSQRFGAAEVSVDDGATWQPVSATAGHATWPWVLDANANGVQTRVRVRGRDAAGNLCPERTVTVTVDQVAPLVTLTEPAAGGAFNSATLRFAGSVTDAASLTLDFADGVGARPVAINGTAFALSVPTSPTEDFVPHATQLRARDAAGNERLITRTVNIDRVAPVLTVASPSEGQLLNATQVAADGTVALQVSALDGDPLVTVEAQTGATTWATLSGTTWSAASASTDDNVEYQQQLRAKDSAGNVGTTSRRYRVDRVAPTVVSTSPTTGTRRNTPEFSVQFSESVALTGTAIPLTFTPSAPVGATRVLSANNTIVTVSGLLGDQLYSAVVDATRVTDVAGNPAVPGPAVSFSTAPRPPTPGTTLIASTPTRTVEWFRASQDVDGVVALAVRVIDPTTSVRTWLLGWLDPKTGQWTQQASAPAGNTGVLLSNDGTVVGNATQRTASAQLGVGGPTVTWTYGTAGSTTTPSIALGIPPSVAEQAGSAVAKVSAQGPGSFDFSRPPNALATTNFSVMPLGMTANSPNELTVFGAIPCGGCGNELRQRVRTCACAGASCSCTWQAETTINSVYVDAAGAPQTIGDLFTSMQVVRTQTRTWSTVERWVVDPGGGRYERGAGYGAGTYCLADGNPLLNGVSPADSFPIAITRGTGPDSILSAAALPGIPPRLPTAAYARLRTISTCGSNGTEPAVEKDLPNAAQTPGSVTYQPLPVIAPVSGATPGVLYVVTPGELKYVE